MPIHISNKKVNDIHVGTKKVLTAWVGTDRVYLASTLSMLIKGYTEKSGNSLLSANTPLKFTGENLLKINDVEERTQNGITYSIKNGVVKIKGTATAQFDIILNNNLNLPKGTYALNTFADFRIIIRDGNSTWRINDVSGIAIFNEYVGQCFIRISAGSYVDITLSPMFVKGNVIPTTFEPYRETFYTPTEGFSLNGINNIYDTFNTINGELTKRFGVVDLGTISFSYNATYRRFQTYRPNDMKKSNRDTLMLCPKYEVQLIGNIDEDNVIYLAGDILYIQDHSFTDAQLFQNSLQGVYLVYELATPQTYQKKPKTLPQWVKHVFDSSGRELEATITQ